MKRKFVVVFELRTLYTTEIEADTPSQAESFVRKTRFNEDHPNIKFLTDEWTFIETQDVGAASYEV